MRAIAYIRVSVVGDRARRGRFESPDLQRAAIDGWCAQQKATVVHEIRDLNRSGGTITRPGLEEALALIDAGEADGIVVARSDRASRRTIDGLGLIDTLERKGAWIAAADGTIDTTTRTGRMATTMHFAMAQSEHERYKEQSAAVHRRAIVEKGRHMGPAPYGYVRGEDGRLVVEPVAAEWVRYIFQRRAEGGGWSTIATELREAGVLRPGEPARFLTAPQVRRMVARRVYVGEANHGEWVKAGAHPGIVSEAQWSAANRTRPAVRSDPASHRAHPVSPLRGLLRCSGCRYAMKRLPGNHGSVPRWGCRSGLPGQHLGYECVAPARLTGLQSVEVEAIVAEAFFTLAARRTWQTVAAADDLGAMQREADEADSLLDELSSLEVRRDLGAERWSRMVADARADSEAKHEVLAVARSRSRPAADLRGFQDAWDVADGEARGAMLRDVVQAVMIDAGKWPVAPRVHVVPVWESLDVPVPGRQVFDARPWFPDSSVVLGEDAGDGSV